MSLPLNLVASPFEISAFSGTVVAIPANDEADLIEGCLAALAMQRCRDGSPLPEGSFEVVLFANNCRDGTAAVARATMPALPYRLHIVEERLPPAQSTAGFARKRAMDLAANRLEDLGIHDGAILTTDADSRVGATWIDATRAALRQDVECVAGYIDADPVEIVRLGPAFLARGRLEDRYLRLIAEIDARCDPKAHDPWPNHRVSSGASLAVTLPAYRAIGGLPPLPLGEDVALTRSLEEAGFRVRHSMDVCVTTSCRFDGRAKGGAAETMRFRHEHANALCDGDLEPALAAVRRALIKGTLRRSQAGRKGWDRLAASLGLPCAKLAELQKSQGERGFEAFWRTVESISPVLLKRRSLSPIDLPREIRRAEFILAAWKRDVSRSRRALPIDLPDVVLHSATMTAVSRSPDRELTAQRLIRVIEPVSREIFAVPRQPSLADDQETFG